MRTLGILGGMAWPSTLDAYRRINEGVHAHLGGHHSAPLIVWSFDFAEVERLQDRGAWDEAGQLLADAASRLQAAGAEGLLLCTNTMHRVAEAIEAAVDVPLLHIADVTAERVAAAGVRCAGLLGTRFTMEGEFYRRRLERHGLEVVIPSPEDRTEVHRIIYDELVHGRIVAASRDRLREITDRLIDAGAEGIIAGCTEIELLLGADDLAVPYIATTEAHTQAAIAWIVGADGDQPTTQGR